LGWRNVLNLLFWLVILIVYLVNSNKKDFWNSLGFKVVTIFGWITLIEIVLILIFMPYLNFGSIGNPEIHPVL
jgi:choline-glycine betaine transporter